MKIFNFIKLKDFKELCTQNDDKKILSIINKDMKSNNNNFKKQINFENKVFNMNIPADYTGKDLFDFSKSKHTNKKVNLTKRRL